MATKQTVAAALQAALTEANALVGVVTPPPPPPPPAGVFANVAMIATAWHPPERGTPGQSARVHLNGSGGAFNNVGTSLLTKGEKYRAVCDASMGHINGMPFEWTEETELPAGAAWNDTRYSLLVSPASRADNARPMQLEYFGYEVLEADGVTKRAHPYDIARLDAMMATLKAGRPFVDWSKCVVSGYSLGAGGAFVYGLRRPQHFAAIFADKPYARRYALPDWELSTWSGITAAPGLLMADGTPFAQFMDMVAFIANPANVLPAIVASIGRRDEFCPWADTVAWVKATLARPDGRVAFKWDDTTHNAHPPLGAMLPTYVPGLYQIGKGGPVLRNSSLDTGSLGDGTLAGSTPTGAINDGFTWRNVIESPSGWSCELSNTLGTVTVDVTPYSVIFPTAGAIAKRITIPAGTWATVNFSVPSAGGPPVGGGTPAESALMTMGGHPLPQRAPLAPFGTVPQVNVPINRARLVTMWHHYNQNKYQRYELCVTLARQPVTVFKSKLVLGAGDAFALDFCCTNLVPGGGQRIPFAFPIYSLNIDGVERARTTVVTGSNQGTFRGTLVDEPDDWVKLEIIARNADGSIATDVYPANLGGESYAPFWLVVDRNGGAKNSAVTVQQASSWHWANGLDVASYCVVPKTLLGSRAPDLTVRIPTPFSSALPSSQITRFDSVPANDSDDMTTFMPVKTLRGIVTTANLHHYFMEEYINAAPRVPLLDGPRGDCTTSHVLHLQAGRNGKWYGGDAWSLWVRYADGSKRTLFGVRHKYAAYWEELEELGLNHPATEFVGEGDPSLGPLEQYPRASWGFAWLKSSTVVDPNATPIVDAISVKPETPHPADVVGFQTDLRGWIWRISFRGNDHTIPAKARIFIRCEEPWGIVELDGVLYVTHATRISKWDALTGAFLGNLVSNPLAASLGAHASWQQFVYNPGQTVTTARAQDYVAWEGLAYQDGYFYGGSFAQQQVCRLEAATGKIEVCFRFKLLDSNNHFASIAVSDGTFGPRGTIALATFTNTYFGRPVLYVPGAGVDTDGTPLTHANRWDYHGWEWGPVRGQNKTQAQVYSTAPAIGNAMLATTAATLGFDVFMQKDASDPVVNKTTTLTGRALFRQRGYQVKYGPNGNGFVREKLPLGVDPNMDDYLIRGCGHGA